MKRRKRWGSSSKKETKPQIAIDYYIASMSSMFFFSSFGGTQFTNIILFQCDICQYLIPSARSNTHCTRCVGVIRTKFARTKQTHGTWCVRHFGIKSGASNILQNIKICGVQNKIRIHRDMNLCDHRHHRNKNGNLCT